MGTYRKGILGAFSGKVGTVVGASWRGKDVLRSLPRKSGKNPTVMQVQQRMRFSTIMTFLTPFNPIIRRFYGANTGEKSRVNLAFGYHMKEALTFVDPDYVVNYAKVILSKGELSGMESGTVIAQPNQVIEIGWADNSGQGLAVANDQLFVAVYEPENERSVCLLNSAVRSATQATINLPAGFSGKTVHLWVGFSSSDQTQYATSTYLGTVVVQ